MEKVSATRKVGEKFGRWTILAPGPSARHRKWICRCDCGKQKPVQDAYLATGRSKSCGCLKIEQLRNGPGRNRKHGLSARAPSSRRLDMTGMIFGRLIVLGPSPASRGGISYWHCRCECGMTVHVARTSLVKGRTRSCGCLNRELLSLRGRDLTGLRFERLTVIEKIGSDRGRVRWRCACECGKSVCVTSLALTSGRTRSCGCIRIAQLLGKRFGRLLVQSLTEKGGKPAWLCLCDCGKEHVATTNDLRFRTKSCGCATAIAARECFTTHGYSGMRGTEYTVWQGMKSRCLNSRSKGFADYGGRGITICDRWRASFLDFLADVGTRPTADHSLDRFPDTNGNYEPGNVRWATRLEQAANKRLSAARVVAILDDLKIASSDLLERAIIDRVRVALLGR